MDLFNKVDDAIDSKDFSNQDLTSIKYTKKAKLSDYIQTIKKKKAI